MRRPEARLPFGKYTFFPPTMFSAMIIIGSVISAGTNASVFSSKSVPSFSPNRFIIETLSFLSFFDITSYCTSLSLRLVFSLKSSTIAVASFFVSTYVFTRFLGSVTIWLFFPALVLTTRLSTFPSLDLPDPPQIYLRRQHQLLPPIVIITLRKVPFSYLYPPSF